MAPAGVDLGLCSGSSSSSPSPVRIRSVLKKEAVCGGRAGGWQVSVPAPARRLARLRLGLAGWVCSHRFPSTPTQRAGGPTPGRPRLTVPRVSEWEGGGVSAGARTEQIPQKAKRGEGGAAVGTDQTRAGFPCLVREQPPGAPDTPTEPAARASPPGRPEGKS